MIKVKYTGTVIARFTKTLTFNDQAEYDDFKQRESDNLLCNIEDDDVEVKDLNTFTAEVQQ